MPRLNVTQTLNDELASMEADQSYKKKRIKRSQHAILDEVAQHASLQDLGADNAFNPTLGSSRHEREWIFTFLSPLYETAYITDVLRRVKGGKEANVYVCSAHESMDTDLLAAKLYRPREVRNLRNDARYRTNRTILDQNGKAVTNDRELHAIRKGSSFGKSLSHTAWIQYEYTTLQLLYDAGIPVPQPITATENTILMEYIGDLDQPAPNLVGVTLTQREARRVRDILIDSIERMLSVGRIHADLSPFNVLYWGGEPVIIDFPQAVSPHQNPEAWEIFQRDALRTLEYFDRYNLHLDAHKLALSIWQKHRLSTRPAILEQLEMMEESVDV